MSIAYLRNKNFKDSSYNSFLGLESKKKAEMQCLDNQLAQGGAGYSCDCFLCCSPLPTTASPTANSSVPAPAFSSPSVPAPAPNPTPASCYNNTFNYCFKSQSATSPSTCKSGYVAPATPATPATAACAAKKTAAAANTMYYVIGGAVVVIFLSYFILKKKTAAPSSKK